MTKRKAKSNAGVGGAMPHGLGMVGEILIIRYAGGERLCFVCQKRIARWALFHDHEAYMVPFDPNESVYVAACDTCVVTAQRQDPAAHNYIRNLGVYTSLCETIPVDIAALQVNR